MYSWSLLAFIIIPNLPCFAQQGPADTRVININSEIDNSLGNIHKLIKQVNFDPLKLSVPATSEIKPFAELNIISSELIGLSTIERAGDFELTATNLKNNRPWVRFHGPVHFEELIIAINCSVSTQGIFGSTTYEGLWKMIIKNVAANISVDFRWEALTLLNPKFHIEDYRSVNLSVENSSSRGLGNILGSFFKNFGKEMVERRFSEPKFKQDLIEALDNIITDELQKFIDIVNKRDSVMLIGQALDRLKLTTQSYP